MTDLVHSGSASIPGGDEAAGASMLEKAARALAVEFYAAAEDQYAKDMASAQWPQFVSLARAVLMAVREPDDSVIEAGYSSQTQFHELLPRPCFTAMIDAILADGEGR